MKGSEIIVENIIVLESPIKVEDGIIDKIDISKINKDLFCNSSLCFLIQEEPLNDIFPNYNDTYKYEEYLYYKDNELYLKIDIKDLEINDEIKLNKDEIITIIEDYIKFDQYIFYNPVIQNKITAMKNKISEEKDWLLIFVGEELPIKYGLINENVIFNRIFIDDSCVFAEAIGNIENPSSNKITLCLKNNKFISAYSDISYIGDKIKYGNTSKLNFKIDNDIANFMDKNLEFKSNMVELPILKNTNDDFIVHYKKSFYSHNDEEAINKLYKTNKLPSMKIDIFNYMLG